MRSLFLKIFLWFWVATILVAGVFLAFDPWGRPPHPPGHRRHVLGHIVALYGEQAVEQWERSGGGALREYCARAHQAADLKAFLFDEHSTELSGQPVPAGGAELAAQVLEGGALEIRRVEERLLVAAPVQGSDQRPYVIVAELPPGPLREMATNPVTWVWRLGAVIIMGGIVCYGLARYLTAPIRRLRAATRRLAGGDLAVRIGARRGRRDEIGELGRDFDYMAERVEALVSAQRRLLRDISHELRSPLARLSVALGLARRAAGTDADGPLDRIEREAERLNELIGQLLTLTRLESGAGQTEQVAIALGRLVHEIVADADFEAAERDRHVRVVAAEDCAVVGSPELLRRAIENVVRNGVQYTREGTEVEVTLRCRTDAPSARATIEVRDHGLGVPVAALTDIFLPFYRVADARERHSGGTGLGLAITAQAIRLHGGTVVATNVPDGGLVVQIELPAK